MGRKGQYMALEAVLSIGLSLIVAVAAIGIFNNYRQSMFDTIEERHASIIKSDLATSIYELENTDSGSYVDIEVPELPQRDYSVSLSDGEAVIKSGGESYRMELNGVNWAEDFSGSASGSEMRVVKIDQDIILRSG